MPSDLTNFGLAEMLRCSLGLRRAATGAGTLEEAAERMNRHLYDTLLAAESGERQLVLCRFYKTHPYTSLEPAQRAFADAMLAGERAAGNLQCLCLVATAGSEAGWNDRRLSQGHVAIPLSSADRIEGAPMVAAMIRQFGLEPAQLVNPAGPLTTKSTGRTYGVFHVEQAVGSVHIPAQDDFVRPFGVQSVVGFGGALPTGAIFAAILFSRAHVTPAVADRFRGIALDAKSMLFRFDEAATFQAPGPAA